MVKSKDQKIKLLREMDLLRQKTDEMNPMTGEAICAYLAEHGISCDIKTLGRDMKFLNEQGFEVLDCTVGRKKAYYVLDRNFSVPELKILMDAVQAAAFVTPDKTDALVKKISALGGRYTANLLQDNVILFNTKKHSNEAIYYNVGTLEEAIRLRKKASFRYFDLNEKGEKIYRKGNWRYRVSPLALIFSDDNYYLMTYHSKFNNILNYRVDRMDHVDIEEEQISDDALRKMQGITAYKEQMFLMFGGEKTKVELQFDNSLIGSVFDRFGENVRIRRIDENTLIATANVQVSPTFYGWVFQFGNKMKILSPDAVQQAFRRMKT